VSSSSIPISREARSPLPGSTTCPESPAAIPAARRASSASTAPVDCFLASVSCTARVGACDRRRLNALALPALRNLPPPGLGRTSSSPSSTSRADLPPCETAPAEFGMTTADFLGRPVPIAASPATAGSDDRPACIRAGDIKSNTDTGCFIVLKTVRRRCVRAIACHHHRLSVSRSPTYALEGFHSFVAGADDPTHGCASGPDADRQRQRVRQGCCAP